MAFADETFCSHNSVSREMNKANIVSLFSNHHSHQLAMISTHKNVTDMLHFNITAKLSFHGICNTLYLSYLLTTKNK